MAASNLKDVARETGLAVSTVSYALRGAPNIPPETAARVRAAADRLGYRVNSRVAELMAQVRRGRRLASGESIALIWVDSKAGRTFGRAVAEGARARAMERGFGLAEFTLSETEGRARRLADIVSARGITGVVFGPVFERARVEMDWPWERFAMAIIGTAEWNAALSRAAHHHYEAMRLALTAVQNAGARRPAAWLDATTNERAHRGWQAAWLAYAPTGSAKRLWLADAPADTLRVSRWLRMQKPDAVVVGDASEAALVREAGWSQDAGPLVLLDWRAAAGLAGVDQGYATIAGHAVDLVIAQLQRNERGLPESPRALLFPGRWREG